ncbi:MAG: PD-(D/E)XK nuclease family protein [Dehalococcoidia bacterium]|nr:PD-(D/E)XK nuclease family protein [Dehalococcoidia bacterium]
MLYTSDEPYATTCAERLAAAGIPFNGPAASTLAETTPGRLLLLLLEIVRRDFRREDVIELFSLPLAAPDGGVYPSARWEILARAAMPGPGIESWRTRLGYLAGVRREDAAARRDEDEAGQARRMETDAEYLGSLLDAVESLDARLRDLHTCDSWTSFSGWCRSALDDFLGGRSPSEEEATALQDVRSVLDDLASLDVIGAAPGVDVFSRALRSQLEGPWGRHGVFEEGVFVGSLAAARGLNFDLVFVAGMVEGLAPRPAREDPLLPDRERRDVPGLEAAVSARASRERDAFLAGTAIAPRRVFSAPLADMRAGREQLPARWLLEICARLQEGDAATIPVAAQTFKNWAFGVEDRPSWLDVIPSQAAGVERPPAEMAPADPGEFDLAALGAVGDAADHPLARALGVSRGIHASRARMSHAFTEWDGFVGSDPDLALSSGQVMSPTGLEHWATCGFRYFLQRVLHVTPVEEPDDGLRIDARDRGSLVHSAIEQFLGPYINAGDVPLPWNESHRAELRAIGEALCDRLEAGGMTGKPLLWRLARRRILAGLDRVLDIDNERFADRGYSPLATELTFGRGGEPLEIPLAEGTARFRGKIDRVDRAADGTLAVIDYKTGNPKPFADFKDNMLDGGRRLQLPVYARAATEHFGAPVGQLAYVFASADAPEPVASATFNDDADRALLEGLQRTDAVMREGVFPAWPGNFKWDSFEHCRWCDFARLCVRDRGRAWNRKMEDPKLEGYATAVGVVSELLDQDAVDPEPSDA